MGDILDKLDLECLDAQISYFRPCFYAKTVLGGLSFGVKIFERVDKWRIVEAGNALRALPSTPCLMA